MSHPEDTSGWDERLRRNDAAAAEEVFVRYARRLVRVAEAHLSRKLRGRVDGEDVVQSALRTFFRRCRQGEFRIDSSGHLWRLLTTITVMKARAQGRYHSARKRDARAEASAGGEEWALIRDAREPGPAEAAALTDQIEALLHGLPPQYGDVLQGLLQGQAVGDVARGLGVSRQTVYRMIHLLQDRLAALEAEARGKCGEV